MVGDSRRPAFGAAVVRWRKEIARDPSGPDSRGRVTRAILTRRVATVRRIAFVVTQKPDECAHIAHAHALMHADAYTMPRGEVIYQSSTTSSTGGRDHCTVFCAKEPQEAPGEASRISAHRRESPRPIDYMKGHHSQCGFRRGPRGDGVYRIDHPTTADWRPGRHGRSARKTSRIR